MARARGVTLWGWWLAAIASATIGSYAPTPWVQLGLIAIWTIIVLLHRHRVWSMRPFALALIAAAAFVGIRMFYTALFGGVSPVRADGAVLWALPQVWLPGPFSGIHLFGAVSLEMLLSAASDALRFAVVFVSFGAASTLVDARRLLARVPKPLAGIGMTLAIALNIFGSLALVTQSLNRARLMRGERSRWRMLLPLFEHTLERAQSMALSMLARGWHQRDVWEEQRAAQPARSCDAHPPLEVEGLSVSYGTQQVLRDVSLTVEAGSLTLVTGATGSGKSTLLAHIRGAVHPGDASVRGEVLVYGAPASLDLNVGLTTQRAEYSFVAATVREELEFAATPQVAAEVARELGLEHLLERRIEQLSAGEASLVAVAAASASRPRLLLLDEPIADLDDQATQRLSDALSALRAAGTAIVVAEHRPRSLVSLADRIVHLSAGQLNEVARPSLSLSQPLAFGGQPATTDSLLAVQPGSITAVVGPNGSGKTTLLESVALIGRIANPAIALVSHRVDDYFFHASLTEEFRHNDRLHDLNPGTTEGLVRRLVPVLPPLETHPRDCSAGTRVALAIALQLSLCRPILLLDEPTRGLDAQARAELAGMLRETAVHQIAVVFATHDDDFVREVADQVLLMPPSIPANPESISAEHSVSAEVTRAR